MIPVSVDIKDILIEAPSDFIFGTNLFIGDNPDEIEDYVSIFDTGGIEQDPKFALDSLNFMVKSLSKNYLTGFELLNKVRLKLEGMSEKDLNNNKILGIWIESPPTFLGYDENDRGSWSMNARVSKQIEDPNDLGHRRKL